MRKLFLTMVLCAYAILSSAQNAVYFDILSEKTQVGMGISGHSKVLGVIQKTKKDEAIRIEFADQFGNVYYSSDEWEVDTTIVYGKGKNRYVEYDFIVEPMPLFKLYDTISANDIVLINGEKFSATLFKAVVKQVDETYNKPKVPPFNGRFFLRPFRALPRRR